MISIGVILKLLPVLSDIFFTNMLANISEPSIHPPYLSINESPAPSIAPPNTTARKCSVLSSKGIFSNTASPKVYTREPIMALSPNFLPRTMNPAIRNGKNTNATHMDRLKPVSLLMTMAIPAVP